MIDWMDGQPAPEAVLELLAYKCTQECTLPRCVYMANRLRCIVSDTEDIAHEDASEDTSDSDNDY